MEEYTRENLFFDIAENIMSDCHRDSAFPQREMVRRKIVDRLRHLTQLIEDEEI